MAMHLSIRELRELTVTLTTKTEVAFDQLSPSFLKRRLNLFGDKKGIRNAEQLIERIEQPDFVNELLDFIIVPVTELFRDPGLWRKVRDYLKEIADRERILVWLPQVSSGEELYSLLIIAKELGVWDKLEVIAGYSSEAFRKKVKCGLFHNKKIDNDLYNYKRYEGKDGLEEFIQVEGCCVHLDRELLQKVELRKGHFLGGVPDEKVDLVLFRNVLLYCKKEYHNVLKEHIDKFIKPGGWLCLGVREGLQDYENRFECIDEKEKIYQKYSVLTD